MLTVRQLQSHPDVRLEVRNPRGHFHLVLSQDVLMVIPMGTWNLTCAKRYIDVTTALLQSRPNSRFGGIICLEKWQLATPEVMSLLSEFNQFSVDKGLACEALIGARQTDIAVNIIDSTVIGTGVEVLKTIDIEAALDFMEAQSLAFDRTLMLSVFQHRNHL